MLLHKLVFTILLSTLFISNTIAQVAEKSEDICPLLCGEKIPNNQLADKEGTAVSLNKIISKKPTVLVFYRGGWCPYCSTQLAALGQAEKKIIELGYQIVGISPDNYKTLQSNRTYNDSSYSVYSDSSATLIQAVGIGYKTPLATKGYIASKSKYKATDVLPVPSVFVLDTDGKILFEYINPDYKTRLSSEMLLAILKSLKK
jgi:peroxiredoxin